MVMVPGPLSCMNNQEQGDTEQECGRIKLFGEEREKYPLSNLSCSILVAHINL